VPTTDHVVRTHVTTLGISVSHFALAGRSYNLADIGRGQLSDRTLETVYPQLHVLMYAFDPCCAGCSLGNKRDAMAAQLSDWKAHFQKMPVSKILVVFTKVDLLDRGAMRRLSAMEEMPESMKLSSDPGEVLDLLAATLVQMANKAAATRPTIVFCKASIADSVMEPAAVIMEALERLG
jgi:hypothetical protein